MAATNRQPGQTIAASDINSLAQEVNVNAAAAAAAQTTATAANNGLNAKVTGVGITRIEKVTALPASPVATTLYVIPE